MRRTAPLLVAPLLVVGLAACSGSDAPPPRLEPVGLADVREVVDAPGTVTAKAVSTLTAPADATVAAVLVQDGAAVTPGQVLVRLSSPSAQDRLRQAEAAAAGASTRIRVPRADLEPLQAQLDAAAEASLEAGRAAAAQVPDPAARASVLAAVEGAHDRYAAAAAASRSAVDAAGQGADELERALSAVGSTQRAQAQVVVAAARATVDALVVTAPFAGVVTLGGAAAAPAAPGGDLGGLLGSLPPAVQEQAGAALGSGGSAPATSGELAVGRQVSSGSVLATVTDVSGLGLTAEVDETDVLLVRPGVPAEVDLDAVPGEAYTALVTAVDVSPTSAGGGGVTYRVRLALTEPPAGQARPLPGMSAVVGLRVKEALGAVSVPSSAVVRDGAADVVYVLDGPTYRRREVQVGASGEDRVEVLAGVRPGEQVVVSDADGLRDGQRRE